jgi:hypothetical protein
MAVSISNFGCSGATGTITPPTTSLTCCLVDTGSGAQFCADPVINGKTWTVTFPDVPPGNYRVRAAGDDGSKATSDAFDCLIGIGIGDPVVAHV